jgi:hypothetical protein
MRAIFRRRSVFVAVALVGLAGVLARVVPAATPAVSDKLATTIEKRLNQLGNTTDPMTHSVGYFDRNPILPERAFYTYAGCRQPFRFSVLVYKTKAQAAAMYDYFHQRVLDMGGDFHAFNMIRRGRVIYLADTASAPDPGAPSVPTKDFQSLAAEVGAPLTAHPHGCPPAL